ncbi:MAG: hypothetical protein ACOX55_05995 [Christensenellales bacterium]|jgi:hypothetical protein
MKGRQPLVFGKMKSHFSEALGIILLACIMAFAFYDTIFSFVESMLPEETVRIKIIANTKGETRPVTIYSDGNINELFPLIKKQAKLTDEWSFHEGERGKSWTSLSTSIENAELLISCPINSRKYILFECKESSGIVEVTINNGKQIINTHSNSGQTELRRVYPFADSVLEVAFRLVLYAILVLLIGVIFSVVLYKTRKNIQGIPFFTQYCTWKDTVVVWAILYLVGVFQYKIIGIPNYLQMGDEYWYWTTSFFKDGNINVSFLKSQLPVFRGWSCLFFPSMAHVIAGWLRCSPVLIWLFLPSLCLSFLTTKVFPEIAYCLTNKKPYRLEAISILFILLITWTYFLTSVETDMFSAVGFFAFVMYALQFFRTEKITKAMFAGIAGSLSCNLRSTYLFGIVAILIFLFLKNTKKKQNIKWIIIGVMCGVIFFIIVSVPQLLINLERGTFRLLPYDNASAWRGRSLLTWSSDYALTTGNVAYPIANVTDDQMLSMKGILYEKTTELTNAQLLDVYSRSPLEAVMLIIKKLIIGFDIKTGTAYPVEQSWMMEWRNSTTMFYSLFNYVILVSGLYVFFSGSKIQKIEKQLGAIIFIILVLPQVWTKIEWRYILSGYLFIYYMFAFHFLRDIVFDKEERNKLYDGYYLGSTEQ